MLIEYVQYLSFDHTHLHRLQPNFDITIDEDQLSHPELDASGTSYYPPTNSSAFWGDSVLAPRQLVEPPNARFDFLIGDLPRRSISNQLSSNFEPEVTMGLLACRSRLVSKRNLPVTPQTSDYTGEFLTYVSSPLLSLLLKDGTRVITDAWGLDHNGSQDVHRKTSTRERNAGC